MDNATIIIPFYYDSDDRMANLLRALLYLNSNLNYNIVLVNQDIHSSGEYIKNFFKAYNIQNITLLNLSIEPPCYKSKLINEGLKTSKTSVNIIYDCDVLIPKEQLILGVELINKYGYKVVYPYSNPQYNLPKTTEIETIFDFEKLQYSIPPFQIPHNHQSHKYPVIGYSPGFCIIVDKSLGSLVYYNENFRSPQFEDSEYIYKMSKFNIKMTRVYGPVFHVDHERTEIGYKNVVNKNQEIFNYIKNLNEQDLKKYYEQHYK
jgi:hypothetical protein